MPAGRFRRNRCFGDILWRDACRIRWRVGCAAAGAKRRATVASAACLVAWAAKPKARRTTQADALQLPAWRFAVARGPRPLRRARKRLLTRVACRDCRTVCVRRWPAFSCESLRFLVLQSGGKRAGSSAGVGCRRTQQSALFFAVPWTCRCGARRRALRSVASRRALCERDAVARFALPVPLLVQPECMLGCLWLGHAAACSNLQVTAVRSVGLTTWHPRCGGVSADDSGRLVTARELSRGSVSCAGAGRWTGRLTFAVWRTFARGSRSTDDAWR